MKDYGKFYETDGRFVIEFKRRFPFSLEKVFQVCTQPETFKQWYPFATGEMDLRVGGKIQFDDGEGSKYEGEVVEFNPPNAFCFQEVEDLLEIKLDKEESECNLIFKHTFDDRSMAMYIAAGWHRCLDVLGKFISDQPVEWEDNAVELRQYYGEAFNEIKYGKQG